MKRKPARREIMQQPTDDKKKGKYRYLAGNIVLFSISNFVSKILVFLLVPFYTNVLTTADYGIADVMQTTLLLLVPALTINMGEAALRFGIDRSDKRKDIFRTGLKFVALASLAVAVCSGIGCLFVRRDIKWYLFLFIFLFMTNCCYEFLVLFFQGCEQVGTVVCGSITSTLVLLVSNIIFLLVVKIGLNGYLLSQMLAFTCASMLMLVMGRRRIPGIVTLRTADGTEKTNASAGECEATDINPAEVENSKPDKEFEREMIAYGLPMIAYSTGSWINNAADRYLVSFIKGVAVNGVYGVAYKIPAILTVFQRIFAQAWQMSATKSYGDDNSKVFFSTMYNMYNTFMVIGCSILILLVKPVAFLLFKKDFYEAWQYVPPLLISVVFGALTGFLGSICLAYKDSKAMGWATGTGALVNIVLNLILIPKYSAMGAAVATGISYFIMYCLAYKKVSKYVKLDIRRLRDLTAYVFLIIESVIMIAGMGSITTAALEYRGYAICAVIVILIICMYVKDLKKIIASLMSYFIKGNVTYESMAEKKNNCR